MKPITAPRLFLIAAVLAFGGARLACRYHHSKPILFDLTAAQELQVERLNELTLRRTTPLKQELSRTRWELIALLRAPDPDNATVETRLRQISRLEDALQREFVQHLLRVKRVLTPDQQERLFHTMGQRLLPRPPWMSQRRWQVLERPGL
jgi:Spy/CpxP family protein refolding chaperone